MKFIKSFFTQTTNTSNNQIESKLNSTFKENVVITKEYNIDKLLLYAKKAEEVYKVNTRYLLFDYKDELIIAIQGTDSLEDIKINLTIGNNYYYHDAMMDLAIDILYSQDLLNKIILQCKKKIVFASHSLGSSVSLYILLLLRLYHPEVTNVFVYSFGCPAVIPSKYIPLLEPFMTCIVNEFDLVPTMLPSMTWTAGGTKILHLNGNQIIERHWSFFKKLTKKHNTKEHTIISYINHLQNICSLQNLLDEIVSQK
jgi:hypothetical protein